jgi:hypothetical protein
MQRRWAAVCIAFFLVMGASAFSVMALAEAPTPDLDGQSHQNGSTFDEGGTTYTVAVADGDGELSYDATVDSEAEWGNNTEIEYRNGTYNVSIEAGNDSEAVTLVQAFDVPGTLEDDTDVENSTFTRDDGTEVVVYRNGTTQPLEEYLDRDRETFSEGDTIEQDNRTKTVANVTSDRLVVTWDAEATRTVALEEGETFTLGDTEYVATFPDNDTVVISPEVEAYDRYENSVDYYHERTSGLLYVIIFSGGASFLLAALAFLPHRG